MAQLLAPLAVQSRSRASNAPSASVTARTRPTASGGCGTALDVGHRHAATVGADDAAADRPTPRGLEFPALALEVLLAEVDGDRRERGLMCSAGDLEIIRPREEPTDRDLTRRIRVPAIHHLTGGVVGGHGRRGAALVAVGPDDAPCDAPRWVGDELDLDRRRADVENDSLRRLPAP